MTTEALENLIEDPDVFALGIDSTPIRDVLVEIATRVDVLQLKIAKIKNEDDSFDRDEMHDINVRLNELSKRQDQQNADFTNEITDLKQYFNYQLKDLRDSYEKSNKQIINRLSTQMLPEETPKQLKSSPESPKKLEKIENYAATSPFQSGTDNLAIRKLTNDVQSLRDKIDSLVSTIDMIKEDSFQMTIGNDKSLVDSMASERSNIPDDASVASISSDDLKVIKNVDSVSVMSPLKFEAPILEPDKMESQQLELKIEPSKALEKRIEDIYQKLETVYGELNNNRNNLMSLKKTTNKLIVEVDSQQKDMKAINKQSNDFVEEFEKLREKITEVGFDADKRLNGLKEKIEEMETYQRTESDQETVQKPVIMQTVGADTSNIPDFEEVLASMKKDIEKNISDVDTNFRTQIHYMKQEMTNIKTIIKNLEANEDTKEKVVNVEVVPEPELKPPPSFKPIVLAKEEKTPRKQTKQETEEEEVEEIKKKAEPEPKTPKKIIFRSKTQQEEKEPKKEEKADDSNIETKNETNESSNVETIVKEVKENIQRSAVTMHEYVDIETMTNPSELGEIPVTRVSFGTPLTSMPNEIQTQFIADRKPGEKVRRVSLKHLRENSSKHISVSSNTPPYDPNEDGAQILHPEDGSCNIEEDVFIDINKLKRSYTAKPSRRSFVKIDTPKSNRSEGSTNNDEEENVRLNKVGTGVEKVDVGNNSGEMNVDRETTPAQYIEVVDAGVQTEISVYATIGTTPIPTRQTTSTKQHRVSPRKSQKYDNVETQPENNKQEVTQEETQEEKEIITEQEEKEINIEPEEQNIAEQQKSKPVSPKPEKREEAVIAESPRKEEPQKKKEDSTSNLNMFDIDNASKEDLKYMEQYNVDGNIYSSQLDHETPTFTPKKKVQPSKATFSFERMLALDIVTEVKAAPIVIAAKSDNKDSELTQGDKEEIINKVAELTRNQKIEELESSIKQTRSTVDIVKSKVNQIPDDFTKRFVDLQGIVRRWVENCSVLHKKVSELSGIAYNSQKPQTQRISLSTESETKSGTISIPPMQKTPVINNISESSSSAVTKPKLVIERKNEANKTKEKEKKEKENMFVFTRIEMVNSPPSEKVNSKDDSFIDSEEFQLERDTIKENVQTSMNSIEELKYNLSRLENDIFAVAHEFEEYKLQANSTQPQTIEYYYVNNVKVSKEEALNAQGEVEKIKQENEQEIQIKEEEKKPEEAEKENTPEANVAEIQKTSTIEERLKEAGKEMADPSNTVKNVLIWEMQPCNSYYVDSAVKESKDNKADIDVDNLAIPRYDEQFRIMRDALVDMRTNQQIYKQRTDEKFQQIIQKQISLAANDNTTNSAQIGQFKKGVEAKLDEYESDFNLLRQELYQFMKDRPERIIEKIKEVVVEKSEGTKTEKKKRRPKKKEEAPPPPPPPPDLDIDLQIKKKKKLIGEIESPRIFNIRPMELQSPALSDDSSEPSTPIVDKESSRPNFPRRHQSRKRLPIIESDFSSMNDDDDTPINLNTEGDTTKSSVITSDSPSRAEEGHTVPQLIDEVSVYNALPKTDYTDKLVPMLMKMRDELMIVIDKANGRTLKVNRMLRNKCDKDYVETFFRKIRSVLTNYDDRIGVLTKALPLRVTKSEFEEKIEELKNNLDNDWYPQQTGTNGTYSRCLFCGSKLPPGKVDFPNPEAVGGRQIPPKTNIVSDHGVVYKGRVSASVLQSQSNLPKLNANTKSQAAGATSKSITEKELPSFLPKL